MMSQRFHSEAAAPGLGSRKGAVRRAGAALAAALGIGALALPGTSFAWPWSRDMGHYIAIKPQQHPMAFPTQSVPVPSTPTVEMQDRDEATALKDPIPRTAESAEKGHQLFLIYCQPCHGTSGTGNGTVGEKLLVRPFDLTSKAAYDIPDGFIFGYLTYGGAIMPVYGNDLTPTERWHVINYLRRVLEKQWHPKPTETASK